MDPSVPNPIFNFPPAFSRLSDHGIETTHIADPHDRRQLRVAYNSIFRSLFHYSYNQSVSALQHGLARPTWEELADKPFHQFLYKVL